MGNRRFALALAAGALASIVVDAALGQIFSLIGLTSGVGMLVAGWAGGEAAFRVMSPSKITIGEKNNLIILAILIGLISFISFNLFEAAASFVYNFPKGSLNVFEVALGIALNPNSLIDHIIDSSNSNGMLLALLFLLLTIRVAYGRLEQAHEKTEPKKNLLPIQWRKRTNNREGESRH